MNNIIQGDFPLELRFVDKNRVYLNFWDSINANDVCCQIKDGKIFKFDYTTKEIEADEILDNPKIKDVFKQTEITLNDFLISVQKSISNQ